MQARHLYEHAIALFKEAGDFWLYGELHLFLANAYLAQGDETTAQTFLKEGFAIHDQVGNTWVTGWFVSLFGEIALRQGDIPRALPAGSWLEASPTTRRPSGPGAHLCLARAGSGKRA